MWPALKSEIKIVVAQCPPCAETAKSKAHLPPPEVPEEMLVLRPMDRLGVDLCHLEGKDFMIMVNMISNFKWVKELKRTHTDSVINYPDSSDISTLFWRRQNASQSPFKVRHTTAVIGQKQTIPSRRIYRCGKGITLWGYVYCQTHKNRCWMAQPNTPLKKFHKVVGSESLNGFLTNKGYVVCCRGGGRGGRQNGKVS